MKATRGLKLIFLGALTTLLLLSVGVSQLFAPPAFSIVGLKKDAALPFLRAIVQLGDRYLIRETFPDSLLSQYPVVLDVYIKEDEMLQKIQSIEQKTPESRDIYAAKILLYERMGDMQQAQEYRTKLKALDPSYEVPSLIKQ